MRSVHRLNLEDFAVEKRLFDLSIILCDSPRGWGWGCTSIRRRAKVQKEERGLASWGRPIYRRYRVDNFPLCWNRTLCAQAIGRRLVLVFFSRPVHLTSNSHSNPNTMTDSFNFTVVSAPFLLELCTGCWTYEEFVRCHLQQGPRVQTLGSTDFLRVRQAPDILTTSTPIKTSLPSDSCEYHLVAWSMHKRNNRPLVQLHSMTHSYL